MARDRREWVLPAVLLAFCLSIPAQLVFAHRFGEPYPGLFQPGFRGVSQSDTHTVSYPAVRLWADGRRVRPADLVPDENRSDNLKSMFPPHGNRPRVDDTLRRTLRGNLARASGTEPSELVVSWQRRRYDLDTGEIARLQKLATYRLDLREDAP